LQGIVQDTPLLSEHPENNPKKTAISSTHLNIIMFLQKEIIKKEV